MSDNTTTSWGTNSGRTLPDGASATYNIGISPLFLGRSGNKSGSEVIGGRARDANLYAGGLSSTGGTQVLSVYEQYVWPSRSDGMRMYALSLRCLVSTNNG